MRRPGTLQDEFEKLTGMSQLPVLCISIDVALGPVRCDLCDSILGKELWNPDWLLESWQGHHAARGRRREAVEDWAPRDLGPSGQPWSHGAFRASAGAQGTPCSWAVA